METYIGPLTTQWARDSMMTRAQQLVDKGEGWRVDIRKHHVEIWHNDHLFTVYKFHPEQMRPWFYPVNSRFDRSVTEEFNDRLVMVSNYPLNGRELTPAVLPHLRSLSIGHADVNNHDVWHEWPNTPGQGRIIHKNVKNHASGREQGLFETESEWRSVEDDSLLMCDRRIFRFFESSHGNRVIDLVLVLTASDHDAILGANHHSLLYARLVHCMSVQEGGQITTSVSSGDQGKTMGKESPWVDYSGPVVAGGPWHGIAILESSNNPWNPHTWSRDYGFMAMGSFHWMEHTIPSGDSLKLGYRVVVHEGNAEEANIALEWAQYEKDQSDSNG